MRWETCGDPGADQNSTTTKGFEGLLLVSNFLKSPTGAHNAQWDAYINPQIRIEISSIM